ncbi:hypothetical protein CBS101457_004987 [Exobasidium rhododendri]|nr:hypothetical protein CBS101457_004987 [Exobasidium rhododendri]
MGGIMFFQYSVMQATANKAASVKNMEETVQNPILGMSAIVVSCLVSGFAGVYTEKVVKKAKTSVWTNNMQLALCSLGPAAFPIFASYMRSTSQHFDLFQGFSSWAWCVVALNLCGGLLVGMTIKYANSILKSFATSFALILTFIFSAVFLEAGFSALSALAVLIVIFSIVAYSRPESSIKLRSGANTPLASPVLQVTELYNAIVTDHRSISM